MSDDGANAGRQLEDDPLWYKDAVIYQCHVKAFADSDGDGTGDLRGLTSKLDYLQDLGVTAIWLLPFYPSPLRDDGYDIADYMSVHPRYGTLEDARELVEQAHARGLRVITELVLNHTSDQHPWFQRARRAPAGSVERNFYVWSDTPDRYKEARIIFKDFEVSNWAWDPVAKSHYWHRFYSHQPDLNYDEPAVRAAVFEVLDFWVEIGVDGFRIDAVPYLFEREGTSCENLPETHAFLRELRAHLDRTAPGRMLLAEANQWPEDAIAYFGRGDECHMSFHFPVMPRLFMAIRMEDRHPVVDILRQTPPIPETCQWAVFLRNHDELTLEMVTDEDRDYMYRVYAQDPQARINLGIRRRLAPLLGNHRRRIELMNALLFSLPGSPILYYGDEIGMGDNIYLGDRNGVRTPMQWSGDRNAGFSRGNPQRLFLPVIIDPEYHYEAVNVEAQQANRHSLLWWTKRMIALRKRYRAFGRGSIEFLAPENRKVLAFVRRLGDETILVVANLSRFPQWTEIDLSKWRGMVPRELFGQARFPPVREGSSYLLTLAPHGFYWFAMQPAAGSVAVAAADVLPEVRLHGALSEALGSPRDRASLEAALPAYLARCRWFRGKARDILSTHIADLVHMPALDGAERGEAAIPASPEAPSEPANAGRRASDADEASLLLFEVRYADGEPETYVLPVDVTRGARLASIEDKALAIAKLRLPNDREGILVDAMGDRRFLARLLQVIGAGASFKGAQGEVVGRPAPALDPVLADRGARLDPVPVRAEQSNTSVIYGSRLVLKLYRMLEAGSSLDVEMGRHLTEHAGFTHTPPVAGTLEYRPSVGGEDRTVAIVQGFVENEGDAWRYTRDAVADFYDRITARRAEVGTAPADGLVLLSSESPDGRIGASSKDGSRLSRADDQIGTYRQAAELLGRRTGEMHLALAAAKTDPAFAPEPFTVHYQRSLYQALLSQLDAALDLLRRRASSLGAADRALADALLGRAEALRAGARPIVDRRITALRTRYHGDYHLGQLLWTGKDFVILDFEGEPLRPLSERRIKRSPLRDVAGMIRSFRYAAGHSLRGGRVRREDVPFLEPWARFWSARVSAVFLRSYLAAVEPAGLFPPDREDLRALLRYYVVEKAAYELVYELNNRPDWVAIPIEGLLELAQ